MYFFGTGMYVAVVVCGQLYYSPMCEIEWRWCEFRGGGTYLYALAQQRVCKKKTSVHIRYRLFPLINGTPFLRTHLFATSAGSSVRPCALHVFGGSVHMCIIRTCAPDGRTILHGLWWWRAIGIAHAEAGGRRT